MHNSISEKQSAQFWEDLKSGRFISMVKESSKGEALSNSSEVYNVMKPLFAENDDVESLYCIFLNSKNRILAIEKMFSGSLTSSMVYPREIVKKVLSHKAAALIIAHNHPSGCTAPSPEDISITKRMQMALSSIDVTLHEHLIIGDGYYSMADSGLLSNLKHKVKNFVSPHQDNLS